MTMTMFVKMETIGPNINMVILFLLTSLLEGASKPIDNEEEESYKAAFAGDTNITMFKLIIAQLLSFILIFPFLTQLLTGITMARSLWDLSR